jgi:putative peptidoglycan binding protein
VAKLELEDEELRAADLRGSNGHPPSVGRLDAIKAFGRRRAAALVLAGVIGLALIGWLAAKQIRSPAQIAADTAPPKASPITVPVERQVLAAQVPVRGTVRYGAPQAVVLGRSKISQGSDIVTRPPRRQAKLGAGQVAMAVDGRPVFVMQGSVPMHRDLHPGAHGPDVRQLERGLARLGLKPGAIDGRYDRATGAAVASLYLRKGWDPFGATDVQRDQLRNAEAAAAAARDAYLQAVNSTDQARRTVTPAEIAQARIDAETARDAVDTAVLAVETARAKLAAARRQATNAATGVGVAEAEARRDQAAADADVASKRADLNAAMDEERLARARRDEVPPDAAPSEREAAAGAARQSADKVVQAQAQLDAAIAAANAIRAGGPASLQRARNEAAQTQRDSRETAAELSRAQKGVASARRQARLTSLRVGLLARPTDTRSLQAIAGAAAQEMRATQREVARLSEEAGVQVPANELLFFPTLPLRVDAVKAKRGSTVLGSVMTVTNSRLVVDTSLTIDDAKLVRAGDLVTIEDTDLRVRVKGRVSRVAQKPGTNGVTPDRVYAEVTPFSAPQSLVGRSVLLTIEVRSTSGPVLVVPVTALSLAGDGSTHLQVVRGGRTQVLTVTTGLSTGPRVEVRATDGGRLAPGDLVVVGTSKPDQALIGRDIGKFP